MANSAQIRTGLNSLIQTHISNRLRNTLFNRLVLFYFLFGRDGQTMDGIGLGRPKTASFVSGIETAKAKKESIIGARVYEPIIQTTGPAAADGKTMGMYDTVPTRANWTSVPTSGYFTRPRFKFCEVADPYKIANKEVRTTKSISGDGTERADWKAVVSMFQAETSSVLATHEKRWNDILWGVGKAGNATVLGYPTSEDAVSWDNLHSLQYAIHDSNTYGGIDRSVSANSWWRGNRVTAATVADFETMINYANYDLGLSQKGFGLDLMLVDGTNFKKAKAEAKVKGFQLINNGGIPDYGQFGFKRELVRIDNTYICYDPTCPSGHVAGLNLATWTLAIHPDANFKVTGPKDQSEIEGGDDAQTGLIRTEVLLCCELPAQNIYWTNVA